MKVQLKVKSTGPSTTAGWLSSALMAIALWRGDVPLALFGLYAMLISLANCVLEVKVTETDNDDTTRIAQ